jgi:hypothetical protein
MGVDMSTSPEDMLSDMPTGGVEMGMQPVDMGPADMTMTPVDMGVADMPDVEDMLDLADVEEYACFFPSSDPMCPQGPWGAGSLLSEFFIVPNATCCFDYTGNGQIDNRVGTQVIGLANNLGFADVNAAIARAVGTGELVYLITYANWENETQDLNIDMKMLTGTDTDLDYLDNLQGTGSFFVSPDSFEPHGDPKWRFANARVFASKLSATGGRLNITFPGLVDDVDLLLENVRIEADVVPGASLEAGGRVALINGRMGGALVRDRFYDSLNVVARNCGCIGQDILEPNASRTAYVCKLERTVCEQDPDDGCRTVGDRNFCFTLGLLSSQTDIDLNGDGRRDAFSFGATFTAVGTQLLNP